LLPQKDPPLPTPRLWLVASRTVGQFTEGVGLWELAMAVPGNRNTGYGHTYAFIHSSAHSICVVPSLGQSWELLHSGATAHGARCSHFSWVFLPRSGVAKPYNSGELQTVFQSSCTHLMLPPTGSKDSSFSTPLPTLVTVSFWF
jgi:hypothetical protein